MVIFQPSPSSCQSGSRVWPFFHRTLISMTVLPLTMPLPAGVDTGHPAGLDGPGGHREILGGLRVFGHALDLVQLDAERVGDQLHSFGEYRGALGGHRLQFGVVDRHVESDGPLGLGRVVEGGVGGLGIVTLSTRSQAVAATIASSSAKPGLTPEPNIVDPPLLQASSMRARPAPRLWPVMNDAEATTLTPADRIRTSSSTSIHIGL